MRVLISGIMVAVSIIVLIPLGAETTARLSWAFREIGIASEYLGDFEIVKDIKRSGESRTFRTVLAKNRQNEYVRIEVITNITAEEAKRLIQEKFTVLEGMYLKLPSPYPGMISSEIIDYDADLKPEVEETAVGSQLRKVYFLYSTSRFTYGVKSREQARYRGANFFIYLESKNTVLQLELFIPLEIYEKSRLLRVLKELKYS